MHDARVRQPRLSLSAPIQRLIVGFGLALLIAISLTRLPAPKASGEYNDNPTVCHHVGMADFEWWWYHCWLPDPPGEPF